MNEHSSLVHYSLNNRLASHIPHATPSPTLLFQFPLLGPSLWGSPYPLPTAPATCSLCTDEEEPAWHIASDRRAPPSRPLAGNSHRKTRGRLSLSQWDEPYTG